MSKHLLLRNGFGGDIAGKIVLLDNPGAAIIYAMRGGARFRLSANFFSNDTGHPDAAVEFVLVPEPARQADGRDAEIARLTAELERHRMTERERVVVADAADIVEAYDSTSDDPPSIGGQAIRNYLDRTAPEEA